MGAADLFLNPENKNKALMTLGQENKDNDEGPDFSTFLDGAMKVGAAAAPMIDNIGKSKDERMNEKGELTHKVNTGANILSMGSTGAEVGASFGPGGALIGAGAGVLTGLVGSILDSNNQPTLDDRANKKKRFNMEMHTKTIRSNDTLPQQVQAAAKGVKSIPNTKIIEVERDEIVLRKNGKAFKKVADFKGGKLHAQGGEKYVASEDDIIIPKKKRLAVNQALRTRDWKRIESIRQQLPKDTTTIIRKGEKEYRQGTQAIKTYETGSSGINAYGGDDIIKTQNYIYNKLITAGLTPNAAKGIVANLTYESDNFSALEERAPNKRGTRGLGLAQWTNSKEAPRRTAFEDFLKERGVDASDLDANIEFLVSELEGEQGYQVGTSIQDLNTHSDSVADASMRVLTKFERPQDQSEEHNAKRLQRSQDFLTQEEIPPLFTPEGEDKPVQLTMEQYQAEVEKSKTPEQRQYEKEKKEGNYPYWNPNIGKGKEIANYKKVRNTTDRILARIPSPTNPSAAGLKLLDKISPSIGNTISDFVSGLNIPERIQGRDMEEVGFIDTPRGKKVRDELNQFTKELTLGTGVGSTLIGALEGFNMMKDYIVSGQHPDAALPNAVGNLAAWLEPEELQAKIEEFKKQGKLSPWAEDIIKDVYDNPENWYTEDMKTGFVFDMATLIANPKGLYQLGKGGVKLVVKGTKGAKKGIDVLVDTLKNVSIKDLKKVPALTRKGMKSIANALEDGSYVFKKGESMDDFIAISDKIDNSGVPLTKSTKSTIDKMRATKEFLTSVPDKVRKTIVGKSFTEVQEMRKAAEKITGKSADELLSMSKAEVAELYQTGITKRLDDIAEATKAKEEAWKLYADAKSSHKGLLAEKKALETGKASPIELGKVEDKIKAAETQLGELENGIQQVKTKELSAYKEIDRLEGFMDDPLYMDKWRTVRDLNNGVQNQMKVLDQTDDFVKAAQRSEANLVQSLKNLDNEKGILQSGAIKDITKVIDESSSALESARTVGKQLTAEAHLVKPKQLKDWKKGWDEFPELFRAIEKDEKALKALRNGTKTLTQIAATIEHAERENPDSKITKEIEKVRGMSPEDFPTLNEQPTVKDEGLKSVGIQDLGAPNAPTVNAGDDQAILDLKEGPSMEKDLKKNYGEFGKKIGAAFEDLAAYAPAIYNIAKGLEKPDKIQRRFVTPQTKTYENMSQGQLNLIDDALNVSLSNARNLSGGLMSNFRSNASKAWAEKIARTAQVNTFEAERSNQIANENIGIRNRADEINTKTHQQADIVDMQSEAATKSFLSQGINDIANISAVRGRDRNANKNQNMILSMMETPNFKFNQDSGEISFKGAAPVEDEEVN